MKSLTEEILDLNPPQGIFSETHLHNLYPDRSHASIKALVHRAVKVGEITSLKRGLFCLSQKYAKEPIHPFIVASLLYGQTAISFETSLRLYGLIPEATYQIASTSIRRSKKFSNSLGSFTYVHIPYDNFRVGVHFYKVANNYWVPVAKPFRALADIIYIKKGVTWKKDGLNFIEEYLRIDLDELAEEDQSYISDIVDVSHDKRVQFYMTQLRKELSA